MSARQGVERIAERYRHLGGPVGETEQRASLIGNRSGESGSSVRPARTTYRLPPALKLEWCQCPPTRGDGGFESPQRTQGWTPRKAALQCSRGKRHLRTTKIG